MEFEQYLRFTAALLFVLALILVLARVLRHTRFGAGSGLNAKQRRLAITETLALDTKRRLVLFRRDDCEHLILLGPTGDLVIETIQPKADPSSRHSSRHESFQQALAASTAASPADRQPEQGPEQTVLSPKPGGETA